MLAHESVIIVEENNLFGKVKHYNDNNQGNWALFAYVKYNIVAIWSQNSV